MNTRRWLVCGAALLVASAAGASSARATPLRVGAKATQVVLKGDDGGKVKGGAWDSATLKGKLHVLFYVDPDHSETNEHVAKALKKASFPSAKVANVAVVNMDATWLPNFAIKRKLKSKQKKYPDVLYVMDKEKVLVKRWRLADNASDVVLFDGQGKVLFLHNGKLPQNALKRLLSLIRKHISK
jgi:YtfJ family uncharacterized protein